MKKIYAQLILSNDKKINLELYPEIAPKSVENFVKLASSGYYKKTIFHRIIENFMIQGGGYYIENNTLLEKEETTPIKGEFKSNGVENDLLHDVGVISMARTNVKDSATSQFFICTARCPHLDGEYAAFGRTTDEASKNVALEISQMPTGMLNAYFQDFPYEPISIVDVKISEEVF